MLVNNAKNMNKYLCGQYNIKIKVIIFLDPKRSMLSGQCKPKHFECIPGECIPSPWVCDGEEVRYIRFYTKIFIWYVHSKNSTIHVFCLTF